HRRSAVEVGDRHGEAGVREHPGGARFEPASGAGVHVPGAERLPEDTLDQVALLVRGPAADDRGRTGTRLAQAFDSSIERALPCPRAEAISGRRERAHRAQLDDVAGEGRDVRPSVERAHERVVAALEECQLVVLSDLLREAHAPVAEDAALAVDRDEWGERDRLGEVALRLDEAAPA